MIKIKFTNSKELKINPGIANVSALLLNALRSVGFQHVKNTGDSINFKRNLKDEEAESFQRRYGNGSITYSIDNNRHLKIRILKFILSNTLTNPGPTIIYLLIINK